MFPKGHKDLSYISEARRICRTCPVRKDCLEYALSFPTSDLHGVWAGLTPRQLSAEAQRLGISPERFTLAQVWAAYNKPK
jgi:WhiB family redox-sensing transcriptional regulator